MHPAYQFDAFSACLALGPVAVYLAVSGAINLREQPTVVNGARETLGLAAAVFGLAVVGPMRLFMPEDIAAQFGAMMWIPLVGFYVLCVTLLLLVGRPSLIVHNSNLDIVHRALADVAAALDPDCRWAGRSLAMPNLRVNLRLEAFPPLHNVSLLASGFDQSTAGWNLLEAHLRTQLASAPILQQRAHGIALVGIATLILGMLATMVASSPESIAQGFERMLNP